MSAETIKFSNILHSQFGSDYTQVWNNTLRATTALAELRSFYMNNSTPTNIPYVHGFSVMKRTWNDPTFEPMFVEMFDELGSFLMAQTSDDLILMTLSMAFSLNGDYHISAGTNICNAKCWPPLVNRCFPLMKKL